MVRYMSARCIVSLSVMTILLWGCASTKDMPPQTVSQLTSLRGKLADARTQLQSLTSAARDLRDTNSTQVQPQIDRFNRELAAINSAVPPMRAQYQEAQAQATAYFANWDSELSGMSQSVAESGRERRAEAQSDFDELKAQVAELRAAYQPYISSMDEAGRYLTTDPTPAGVRAMRPTLRQAIDRESTVLRQLDRLIKKMDEMRRA